MCLGLPMTLPQMVFSPPIKENAGALISFGEAPTIHSFPFGLSKFIQTGQSKSALTVDKIKSSE